MKKLAILMLAVLAAAGLAGCAPEKGRVSVADYSLVFPEGYTVEAPVEDKEAGSVSILAQKDNLQVQCVVKHEPEVAVTGETLQAEVALDTYLHPLAAETLKIEGVGDAYGVLVEDHALEMEFLYYKVKMGEDTVALVYGRPGALTLEQQAEAKVILSSLKPQ